MRSFRVSRVDPWAPLLFAVFALSAPADSGPGATRVLPVGLIQGRVPTAAEAVHHAAPLAGRRVSIQGVVTQLLLRSGRNGNPEYGFFVQNTPAAADGDGLTSDGLLALSGRTPTIPGVSRSPYRPRPGDEIILEGTVREVRGMTHLTACRFVERVRTGVALDRELPPAVWPLSPTLDEAALFWERHEGMRVRTPAGCVVQGGRKVFGGGRDAAVWIRRPFSPATGRQASPYARRVFRDAHPLDDRPDRRFDNGNPDRICLGSLGLKGATGDPYALIAPARTFDRFPSPVTGAVYQRYELYSLQPAASLERRPGPEPSANGRRPGAPPASHFTVATFNVENLFDVRDDPDDPCDAPHDPGNDRVVPPFGYLTATPDAYARKCDELARQITTGLGSPDLLLLQEVEDQDLTGAAAGGPGEPPSGPDGTLDVLQDLAAAIQARGGPRYAAAADRGGVGYRGLTCAYLYRRDRVRLRRPAVDHPVLGSAARVNYRGQALPGVADRQNPKAFNARLPVDVDLSTGMADENVFSRAVQAAWFEIRAGESPRSPRVSLYVLNNHFSSRPHQRVGQRREQAAYNAALVRAIDQSEPDVLLLVGGDLNVFPRPDDPFPDAPSDQLKPLYAAGLFNVYDRLVAAAPATAYTYVYQGQAGTLDHLFVSPSLARRLDDVWIGHFNSDYPDDYAADAPFGASDHDPVLATFTFAD